LFYGKLQHLKGADVFVHAGVELARRLGEPVRFHLVGKDVRRHLFAPGYQRQLRAYIPPELQHAFVFHGHIPPGRLPEVALQCSLAVVPSRIETFCLAAHELNWIGVPLVLADLPAFSDYFVDGVNCRKFNGQDHHAVEHLTQTLLDLLQADAPFAQWQWNAAEVVAAQRGAETYGACLRIAPAAGADGIPSRLVTKTEPMPIVSVLVPYHNAQYTLADTLKSIVHSTHADLDVIVIDDGSSQPEAVIIFDQLAEAYAGDPRFRFIHKPNGGLSSARNAGLAAARGKYVLPLDADDLIEPDYIALGVEALERNPDLAAVSCFASYFLDGDTPSSIIDYVIAYDLNPLLISLENRAGVAGSIFCRAHLPNTGYAEALPAYEDWDLWWALAEQGQVAEVIPRILYRYRRRADGLFTTVGQAHHHALVEQIEERHPRLLAQIGSIRSRYVEVVRADASRYAQVRRRVKYLAHRWLSGLD
jgi:glycosyltransferase involved in cell wall biosynthesis